MFPRTALILVLPILMSAQKVTVEFDRAASFSQYKTFAIRGGQLRGKSPLLNSDLVRKRIEGEIRRRLVEKGLREVETRPDLNVRYSLGAARRSEVEAYPAGWRGLRTRRVRIPYTEGTLILDFNDAKLRSLVWRAFAVEEKRNPADIQARLDDMIRKSITKYPPKLK